MKYSKRNMTGVFHIGPWKHPRDVFTFLILTFSSFVISNEQPHGDAEYCELDVFEPSCAQDEVILMKSAYYGRMALGRCITQDYGIGCKADVLEVMDGFCSGRQSCTVNVVNPQFFAAKAKVCPRDGSAYLAPSYSCIKVLQENVEQCRATKFTFLTENRGYISSSSISSQSCSFKIKPPPGRKLNITMVNFPPTPSKSAISSSACYEVGSIREEGQQSKTIHKCLNDPRQKQLYLSNGGHVDILIPYKESHDVTGHFLIHYQATGCPDPDVPDNTELQRNGNKATVTCKNSNQAWELTCSGEKWQGKAGKCSQDVSGWSFLGLFDHEHPYGTAIVVGIGATLGVLTGGTLLYIIIAVFKRCQKSDYTMTYEYTDPNFAHIPTDYHADKSNLLIQDDKLFEQNSNTWGSQRHGNGNTLSRGGTDHSRVPLPPLPSDNNTLSYEKPLYNRNGNV